MPTPIAIGGARGRLSDLRRDPDERLGGPGRAGLRASPSAPPTPACGALSSTGSTRRAPAPCCAPASRPSQLTSVRAAAYVMLRSPDDGGRACYLRLTPEEWQLALLMDGTHTVARLVAEFARIAGRLAPDQVRRVVADLAGNRMLDELPVDAFRPLQEIAPRPLPQRVGRSCSPPPAAAGWSSSTSTGSSPALYRAGGRLLFTRTAAVVDVDRRPGRPRHVHRHLVARQPVALPDRRVLPARRGPAAAAQRRRAGLPRAGPRAGRPSTPAARCPPPACWSTSASRRVFVDTTDVWMAGRRARMLVTAAGPAAGAGAGRLGAARRAGRAGARRRSPSSSPSPGI